MNANDRIVAAAWGAVRGDLPSVPASPGLCLALTRVVIERAFGMRSHEWYAWRTHPVEREDPSVPWARDMERSLTRAGMGVITARTGPPGDPARYVDLDAADIQPGDLLFRWDTARSAEGVHIGHVAIAMPHRLQLENIAPSHRKLTIGMWRGATRLSPLGEWPITSIIRFDPERRVS